MNFDFLVKQIMSPKNENSFQQSQQEFIALLQTPEFLPELEEYLNQNESIDHQEKVFLLSQLKNHSELFENYNNEAKEELLIEIVEIAEQLADSESFDLAIETLFVYMLKLTTSELPQPICSTLYISALARLSKCRISTRKEFNQLFALNYEVLLNSDGVYGLIDSLQPIPPVSYGQCLNVVIDAVLNEEFSRKNNKLLRIICLSASKIKKFIQKEFKESQMFFETVKERNYDIEEFCYSRIEKNEFICDNILILTYLLKCGFDFDFENMQNLLSLCIQIFKNEFETKYSESYDFEMTSDLEFLLEEDVGVIGAATGLFVEICKRIPEAEILAQIQDKSLKISENFFSESLELILMLKAWKIKCKSDEIVAIILQLVELYNQNLNTSVLLNSWSTFVLDQLFELLGNIPNRYLIIIPILNNQGSLLENMKSKLEICNAIKLINNRILEIYTEASELDPKIIELIDYQALLQGFSFLMIEIPEYHYLFTKCVDCCKYLIEMKEKSEIIVSFGNLLIEQLHSQPDKFLKVLEVINCIFVNYPQKIGEEAITILIHYVQLILDELCRQFSQEQYYVLHSCSEIIELLVFNFKQRNISSGELFSEFYEEVKEIMMQNPEYFSECLEGLLSLTSFLKPSRENIVFPTKLESFKVIQLLQLCLADQLLQTDIQETLLLDCCEFPVNWVLLIIGYVANKFELTEIYRACYELFQVEGVILSNLSSFLMVQQLFGAKTDISSVLDQEKEEAIYILRSYQVISVEDENIFSELFYQGEEKAVSDILDAILI